MMFRSFVYLVGIPHVPCPEKISVCVCVCFGFVDHCRLLRSFKCSNCQVVEKAPFRKIERKRNLKNKNTWEIPRIAFEKMHQSDQKFRSFLTVFFKLSAVCCAVQNGRVVLPRADPRSRFVFYGRMMF